MSRSEAKHPNIALQSRLAEARIALHFPLVGRAPIARNLSVWRTPELEG
jgi:hypothetical protein